MDPEDAEPNSFLSNGVSRCDVQVSTPHSSGFREPCIWAFLTNLKNQSLFGQRNPRFESCKGKKLANKKAHAFGTGPLFAGFLACYRGYIEMYWLSTGDV